MSPKILEEKGFTVKIYFNDHPPAHVHVIKEGRVCKIGLSPVEVIENNGMKAGDVRKALKLVTEYLEHCLNAWNEIFPP